jgi:competence protein ComEC
VTAPSQRRLTDVRLAIPAAATWAAVAIGSRLSLTAALAGGAPLVLVAAAVAFRRTPIARLTALGGLAVAAGLVVASLRSPATGVAALRGAATAHASVTADVVVTGDPHSAQSHTRAGRFLGALVLVPASMRHVRVGTRAVRLRAPVLVLAHGATWLQLLPSQPITVSGLLLPARHGDSVAFVVSARGPPDRVGAPSEVQRVAGRLRRGLRDSAAVLPASERGLLPGLVDGDTSGLPDQVQQEFRVTGLTHLVAVSGSNVAIIAAAAFGLARALRLRLRLQTVFAAVAVAGFVVLARPSPSVLRAAVMGGIGLAALATGRHRAGLPALSAAVLALVLIDPSLATSDGFVLSVLATGGLLLVAPRLRDRFRTFLPQWFAESLAVAVAAQLMTTPYIALRFSRVSLLSVPANLLAAPAVPAATVLGVVAAAIAPVWLPFARAVAFVAYLPTGWLVGVAHNGAAVPGASTTWPHGGAGWLLMAACGLLTVVLVRLRRRRMERWTRGPAVRPDRRDPDRR